MKTVAVPFLDAVQDVSAGNVKIPQSEFRSSGTLAVVDQGQSLIAGYSNDLSAAVKATGPVIVFGDHTRAFKYVDFPFAMGADGVKVLRVRDGFEPRFVYRYLRSLEVPSAGYSRHFKFLKQVAVPRPPLLEQRRIATILDHADALRAKRRQVLARLNTLTQSIFHDMFGDIREHLSFGASVEEFRYGTSNKSGQSGHPTLRIPNVIGGALITEEVKTVDVTNAEFERLRLQQGDLLFVRSNGNPDNVGRCAVFDSSAISAPEWPVDEWIYASYLIRARLTPDQDPAFIAAYLAGGAGRRQLRDRSKTSAGQYNINIDGLGSIRVPAAPVQLQQEFALRIETVKAQHTTVLAAQTADDELFASLQSRAFRGDL